MKILIASGIFAPEAGGPATYAPQLATQLAHAGHSVTVVTFSAAARVDGDERYPFKLIRIPRGGKILNRYRFFSAALNAARGCDIIYTLDWFAAGFPLSLAAQLRGIPYVVRVGGDYLWEQKYLESGERPLSLAAFYEQGLHRRLSYRSFFFSIRYVLSRASHVVFNSDIQRELYERAYRLSSAKLSTIYNPVPRLEVSQVKRGESTKEFVFWGRFIVMKNLEALVRAFVRAKIPDAYTLALIGDGPQKKHIEALVKELGIGPRVSIEPSGPLAEIMERVKDCRAFILPSWTDISPNQVYEALAIGLPALVTKENYLPFREQLPEMIDPASVDDVTKKLEMLADDPRYEEFSRRFNAISFDRDWGAVVNEHLALFRKILGETSLGIRVLQIGHDRSGRGIHVHGSAAYLRQKAYAERFGALDEIGYTLRADDFKTIKDGPLRIFPTNSWTRLLYGTNALLIERRLARPSIVSAQDPYESGFLALWIAWRRKVPLHVQVHTDVFSVPFAFFSIANFVRLHIALFVLSRADGIRVVSERIKDSIGQRMTSKKKIAVLPIFTDVAKIRDLHADPALAKRFSNFKTKLLVVGRLEAEKNVSLALASFAKVAPEDSCLIIVGEGRSRAALQLLADSLHVADRVFFEGEKEGVQYYPLADLILVPSRYEGYGLVIVEALAAGKPVLATDVGVACEAGAIITNENDFAGDLKKWFETGPREGVLKNYPYKNFEEYVRAYCEDIAACTSGNKDPKY